MKGWHEIASGIEKIERDEAKHGLRIVNVATNATHLPACSPDGNRVHPGQFGGWIVKHAEFEDPGLVAVIRFNDASEIGLTADGEAVEVVNG